MSVEQQTGTETLADDFIGAEDHGPGLIAPEGEEDGLGPGERAGRRSLRSLLWGGVPKEISSEHGQACGYCGTAWPTSVGMSAKTHPGLDVSMVTGTKLYAIAGGTVEFAGWSPRYNRPHQVRIATHTGQLHIYAHLWSVAVSTGDRVERGDYLGTSGEQTKPNSKIPDGTGQHLHFEVRRLRDGRALDPEPILTDETIPKRPTFAPGDRIKVDVDGLNFRDWPTTAATTVSGSSIVIGKLAAGTELCVTGAPKDADGYTWYPVRRADGAIGWVAGKLCSLAAANACGFEAGDRIAVNESGLRLRSAAGLSASVLERLTAGSELCVAGTSRDSDGYRWYPVRIANGASGWVAGTICSLKDPGGCGGDTQQPGAKENWPTAEAIDQRIALSNKVNGRTSKLTGMGAAFVALGRRYGINPGIVCAIAQRECQLGADGSYLPTELNNFGGNTAGDDGKLPGNCGSEFFKDRYWKAFCTPEDGLEGMFQVLDKPGYRKTGGRFEDIMMRYSPPGDGNPWPPEDPNIFQTFAAVAKHLGISIGFDTMIYTVAGGTPK
jgi:hypothetical protein